MEYKYINEARTQELIDEVKRRLNTRLIVTDVMPESAEDGAMRLYSGETDMTYAQSHIYRYNEAEAKWEDVTADTTVIETVDELPTGNEIKDIFYRTTTGGWRGEYEFQIVADDSYRQVAYNQLDKFGWKYQASVGNVPGSVVDHDRGYIYFAWLCHSAGTKIGYDDGNDITEIKGMVVGTYLNSEVHFAQLFDVDYVDFNHVIVTKTITGGSDTLSLKVWHEAGLYIGDSATQTVTQIYPVPITTKETRQIPCGAIPAERKMQGTTIQFLDSEFEAEGSNLTKKYKAGHCYTCSYDSETQSYYWAEMNTSDSVVWVTDFPIAPYIEDVVYGKITTTTEYTNEKTVGLDSLDTETRITLDGDNYIPASTDNVYVKGGDVANYEVFVSFNTTTNELTTSEGTYTLETETELTFATQTTTETKSFRIGNEERQELTELESGGTEVIANPSETATDTLSKVSIDGTVYEVGSETKVNATAVTSLSGLADGFYLLIDSTATPIYQLKEIADGTATDSDKEIDTCLIDYVLYNDNKTVLDTLDIVWVVTGTPDVSDYKTEFETAKSGIRNDISFKIEWDEDVLANGNFADLKTQWDSLGAFLYNNRGRLALITVDQYNFGFSDDDTSGSTPTLFCITPDRADTNEEYKIRVPYGSALSIHGDGYGTGFFDINLRFRPNTNKCEFAGINTTLFKGTQLMSTGYAYNGQSTQEVRINEGTYNMNDATERAAAYNLYHQGVTITIKLL